MEIRILDPKLDEDILYNIVKLEDDIFKGASIGNYNIKPFSKYGKVYVILEGKEIISVAEIMSSFNREIAYIYGFLTNTKYQNMGYGHKLLRFVIEDLKKENIKNIELTASVLNYKAIKLYEDFGFKIKEILEDEYKDGERRYLYQLNL